MNMDPHKIIYSPQLSEKSEFLKQKGKYVFFVSPDANKLEIADAIEAIYNRGKRKDLIKVTKVNVINVKGKTARSAYKNKGRRSGKTKAIITLEADQVLEDIGA